jgi:beta-lactamase regulating signal transducer with metallopeptidase domain
VVTSLNWLWQGGAIALAAAAMLRVLPRSRTQARYGTLWAAYLLVVALPVMPFITAAWSPIPAAAGDIALQPALSAPMEQWTPMGLVIGLWMAWCAAATIRLLIAAAALIDAKRQAVDCRSEIENRLPHWLRVKTSGRQARLVLSTRVRAAAVLGCRMPVIAVAPALVDRLSNEDLDRVVLHEWAHIQRRDDVAQIVQRLVHVVAGWHPAAWWLERQLELEREVACDELAVALTGSPKGYATCLTTLAALRSSPVPGLPAPAVLSSSGLRRRVMRILALQTAMSTPRWRAAALSASAALASLALLFGHVQVVISATGSSVFAHPADSPVGEPIASNASSSDLQPARSTAARSRRSPAPTERINQTGDAATRTNGAGTPMAVEPPALASVPLPMHLEPQPNGAIEGALGTLTPPQIPDNTLIETHIATAPSAPAAADLKTRSPWGAAADAGVAIGRGSENAGRATAGFFSRVARRVAGSVR